MELQLNCLVYEFRRDWKLNCWRRKILGSGFIEEGDWDWGVWLLSLQDQIRVKGGVWFSFKSTKCGQINGLINRGMTLQRIRTLMYDIEMFKR